MHTAKVLGEEIFAVEFVPFAFYGALRAGRTAIVCQAKMLRSYMPFPLIFRPKCTCAAGKGKCTGERACMRSGDVFAER